MQNIIIDKPYQFVPPYSGEFWARAISHYLPHYLRQTWGVDRAEFRGVEQLRQSLAAGHGILLAPNHCRPCDPMVISLLGREVGRPFYLMASWHLFMEGRFRAWLLRRIGAFSIYREGMDREALKAATTILVEAKRPLVIFPEGIVTRTNDRLHELQDGTAFIARTAAKQRAKGTPPGAVVIHPVALHYYFGGDVARAVGTVLDEIEARLTWRPQRQRSLVDRIHTVGLALLSLKEMEYFGQAQTGTVAERLHNLLDRLLAPLEKEWLAGRSAPSVIERVKRLRAAIIPDLVTGTISDDERARRWRQLADLYLAQQVSCYPSDYLLDRPTPERLLETVERFEEDLTDTARIHRPLRVVVQVGPALSVSPARDKAAEEDPLMVQLEASLAGMLESLSREASVLPQAQTESARSVPA